MGLPGSAAKSPSRLGRYELLARLATGGMGEIFLARLEGAEGFEKLYVVKRILAHLADDARFRQMLIAEARIASKMSHPNICQVFELGETDGQLYIVMEYLEGISLLPLLRRFSREQLALDLGFVAGVMQQSTDAVNYAHELKDRNGEYLGIIHRDVTPSNIFLTEMGVAKVLDFGIAKARGAQTQTQEGTVKGKYAYMAPEQLKGAAIDRRVDVFALGVVLYEMLALRRLFQRKTDYLTFRAVMEQPIPDVRRYRPDVPDRVADAITRALERNPNDRFDTARQLGTAVLDGLQGIRPWTQGEIGDFVKLNFAAEIDKRSQQVANVVHRTNVGPMRATTMPVLATPDDAQNEADLDDDDDGFPSVETEVEGAPPWMQRPTPQPASYQAGNVGDFAANTGSGTPPPFGAESTGSLPSLQPLRGSAPTLNGTSSVVVVREKRSVIWPLLALAMVLVAAGALFLVWQKMQQPPQPAEIKITQESSDRPQEPGPPPPGNPPNDQVKNPTDKPTDKLTDKPIDPTNDGPKNLSTDEPKSQPKKGRPKTYDAAVLEKKAEMVSCLTSHSDAIPKEQIFADVEISMSGKATSVDLSPASLKTSPLGMCLHNVLLSADYPSAPSKNSIRIPLTAKH